MNRVRDLLRSLPAILLAAFLSSAASAEEQKQPEKTSPPAPPQPELIPYVPPPTERPAPRVTSAGGTRGFAPGDAALPSVTLLVPEHVGLTLEAQPTLYWYISAPSPVRVELTISDDKSATPLLERSVPPVSAGLQSLRLADYGVELEKGRIYEWSVALVAQEEEHAAGDFSARGFIERVELSGGPETKDPIARARWLAQHGIWCDALAALSEAKPADEPIAALLRRQRDGLLEQVGLGKLLSIGTTSPKP